MQVKIPIYDREKTKKVLDEFQKETPRAAAILGCAYLDDLLNELLKARLVEDKKLFKDFIDRLTCEQRINLCYLTGTISKEERDDLRIINKIRGWFAHDINLNSFDKEKVPIECDNLLFFKSLQKKVRFLSKKPRFKYTLTIATNMIRLRYRFEACKRIERVKKPWQEK